MADLERPVCKIRDHAQGLFRRLALRRVLNPLHHRDLDRAITLLFRHLDLPLGSVLVIDALKNRNRHADVTKRVGDVPLRNAGSSQAPFQPRKAASTSVCQRANRAEITVFVGAPLARAIAANPLSSTKMWAISPAPWMRWSSTLPA